MTTTPDHERCQSLEENDVVASKIVDAASIVVYYGTADSLLDDAEELLKHLAEIADGEREPHTLKPFLPAKQSPEEAEDWDTDIQNFVDSIDDYAAKTGKYGVFLYVMTPVKKYKGSRASYSWGHCSTNWVYGDTYEEAFQASVCWAKLMVESNKAKAADSKK